MKRQRRPNFLLYSRRDEYIAVTKLIRELWLITYDVEDYQIRSYLEHVRECQKTKDDKTIASDKTSDILKLCQTLNSHSTVSLEDTYDLLDAQYATGTSQQHINERSIRQAISFFVRLCHFVQLDSELRRGPRTIKEALYQRLVESTAPGPDRILKDDFCEKNITRKTSIMIRYTSDLSRHLKLQGNGLYVFRHGGALTAYARDPVLAGLYPPGFLLETQATIDLLFPISDNRLAKRRQRLSKKHSIDLEVGDLGTDTGDPSRQLSTYKYWGGRLQIIDDRYQSSKPGRLKQWYFDRRDATSFTTFWLTFSAFVLAVLFGIISSVTAIMQTWKAYHPA